MWYRVSCENRHFGGKCRLHLQGRKNPRARSSVNNRLHLQSREILKSCIKYTTDIITKKQTYSATCRRNLVPTFVDRGVSRGQRGGSPTVVNLSFLDRSRYISFKELLIYPHEAEWTPFQTHCYSENLVAPGMEPGTSGSAARNSDY
jgi:hypothetical protein